MTSVNSSAVQASQQKKQQSISKFFNPRPQPPKQDQPLNKITQSLASAPVERQSLGNNNTSHASDDDSDVALPRYKSLKRPANEEHDVELPARKVSRTSSSPVPAPSPIAFDAENASLLSKRTTEGAPLPSSRKITQRTSRYLFSNSEVELATGYDDTAESVQQRQKLHQKFVKKLGKPDSFAELRRRNHVLNGDEEEAEDDVEEEAAEEAAAPPTRGRKLPSNKKSTSKLTPMEKQILELKRKHADAILVVEVGYKFRFFGEDARVAAKELGIMCIPGKFRYDEHPSEAHLDRFASASFPTHRLHVHVKRLVAAGHKVGVVRQLETAALKAIGDNRNTPFVRELTNLYTKGTYIDETEDIESPTATSGNTGTATGHILCLTETNAKGWGSDERVHVGIVAVQPATGDIVYDDFEDGFMRSEIETRLLHIAPCEFLIVGELSKTTEKLVNHLSGSKLNVFGDKARVERVPKPKTAAAQAYSRISKFYTNKLEDKASNDMITSRLLDKTHNLSEHVAICLASMIEHLTEYGLQHVCDLTNNFQPFSARSHMLLNGTTLNSLEIYRNQTDNSTKGSLFWVLDETKTKFGQRLLRKWIGRPLIDKAALDERINAVEEIKSSASSAAVERIKDLLIKTKTDLEKSLIRIYYGKCSRPELLSSLQVLQQVAATYAHIQPSTQSVFASPLLNNAIAKLPIILNDVVSYLEQINPVAASENNKTEFFREDFETDDIKQHKACIVAIETDLEVHRTEAAEKLKRKKVEYVTVAGIDYLIEVENTDIKKVPASWMKISGTKKLSRFHTPEVVRMTRERDQHKESLESACDAAFKDLLSLIGGNYQQFRDCVQSLATLDCLMSLAEVAGKPGYCKPTFTEDIQISIKGGRHPMVENILVETYVPNDAELSSKDTRGLLVTGPNMGGKSSYVRQIALIAILGQIGSYVPAESAKLGMLDAVFTRMGAFDNMMAGESTFMVELSETADLLKQATPRSLIILDELGRGTSTFDGVAIAQAVLDNIIREQKGLLLFITHYQSLSAVASTFERNELRNVHVRFAETTGQNGTQDITFLYEIGEGVAHRSYGLNVARLADIPSSVIDTARAKSFELEVKVRKSRLQSIARCFKSLHTDETFIGPLVQSIESM